MTLRIEFTEFIPEKLESDVIYISIPHRTVIHLCACGCGVEVVTPISPTDWSVTFDGETVSLYPSIGNWSFPCRSHYWVKRSKIVWAPRWSDEEILSSRRYNRFRKAENSGLADVGRHGGPDEDKALVVDEGGGSLPQKLKAWVKTLWQKNQS